MLLAAVAACLWRSADSSASTDGIWTVEPPPLAREGHTAIYDPGRDCMLVFGGKGQGLFNDVWALSLSGSPAWTRLTVGGTPPSPRYGHNAIYDPVRERVLVFGGSDGGFQDNDLWELSLKGSPAWTQLAAAGTPPTGRFGHTAIYDPVRDRMVIFGGFGVTDSASGGQDLDDVWALSLAGAPAWTELAPAGTPPDPRHGHSAIYDPVRDRMVVFGGGYGVVSYGGNDTWALSLAHHPVWKELSPAGTPPDPRGDHNAIYDPMRDQMLVFGGLTGNGDYLNPWTCYHDVRALSLAGSTAWVTPAIPTPEARHLSSAIYDPLRDRMVVFGGAIFFGRNGNTTHADFDDALALSLAGDQVWGPLTPGDEPPPARNANSTTYDPLRDRMVVFGGFQVTYFVTELNDTWTRSLGDSPMWAPLYPAGTPPSGRFHHSAIYDPVRERMVVFGGDNHYSVPFNDAWALSLDGSPAWAQLTPAGTPPSPRYGHTAIYDPVRDRMLVFGGHGLFDPPVNDLWALSLAGSPAWTQLSPAGTPPSPGDYTAIHDPVRDRMIVFGGSSSDVWALSLSGSPAWTLLTPAGIPPSAGAKHGAVYDPVRDRMIVFGSTSSDVWALSLSDSPAWTLLAPSGIPPGAGAEHSAVYDPVRDRLVVYNEAGPYNDVWDLAWTAPVSVTPQAGGISLRLDPAYPNPARGDIAIGFALPHASTASLRIYDVSGRVARTLVDGALPAGPRSVRWDRRLGTGALARPGLYFYELRVEGKSLERRLVLTL